MVCDHTVGSIHLRIVHSSPCAATDRKTSNSVQGHQKQRQETPQSVSLKISQNDFMSATFPNCRWRCVVSAGSAGVSSGLPKNESPDVSRRLRTLSRRRDAPPLSGGAACMSPNAPERRISTRTRPCARTRTDTRVRRFASECWTLAPWLHLSHRRSSHPPPCVARGKPPGSPTQSIRKHFRRQVGRRCGLSFISGLDPGIVLRRHESVDGLPLA